MEIIHAIKSMQSGKTPSLDGFPIEFYKVSATKLTPLIGYYFWKLSKQRSCPIPCHNYMSVILPKKDKVLFCQRIQVGGRMQVQL